MGKVWDGSGIAFSVDFWREALRVMKPGAVLLAFGGTRTYHRMASAIEDAGFILEDCLIWLHGQGFPKHKSKLKPGYEPIILARKPGPLWLGVDDCRISVQEGDGKGRWPANLALSHHPECVCQGTKKVNSHNGVRGASTTIYGGGKGFTKATGEQVGYADADGTETVENWTCHPDCPIRLLDEQAGKRPGDSPGRKPRLTRGEKFGYSGPGRRDVNTSGYADSGGASRFFANFPAEENTSRMLYCSKASKKDRGEGNRHNTVKSTTLMSWLVKLACPDGGLVLDPFAGSGSTGVACLRNGRRFFGVESDVESCATTVRRLKAEE